MTPAEAVFWHSLISIVALAAGFALGWITRGRARMDRPD